MAAKTATLRNYKDVKYVAFVEVSSDRGIVEHLRRAEFGHAAEAWLASLRLKNSRIAAAIS
jgi:hypothetical protein